MNKGHLRQIPWPLAFRHYRHWLQDGRIAVPLVLLTSAILLLFAVLAYYMTGDRFIRKTAMTWQGDALTLVAGQGAQVPGGLAIRQLSGQGFAFIKAPPIHIPAQRYSDLVWHIEGLHKETDIHFVWATEAAPQATQGLVVRHKGAESGRVKLNHEAQWQGAIISVGLLLQGALPGPLLIRGLELTPPNARPAAGALLAQLWREWTTAEGWRGYSTHFIIGSAPNSLFSPVLAATAWVGLSTLLYGGLILMRWQRWNVKPFAVFLLAGWLALDGRWQLELWQKLAETYQQYAGKDGEDKHLNAEDEQIFHFIGEIKQRLAEKPVRIFLVSAEPVARGRTEYTRLRAHYHLLPHNVYSQSAQPPAPSHARTDDYVLILAPIEDIVFQQREGLLRWGNGQQLAVELRYHSPMGSLFRVL